MRKNIGSAGLINWGGVKNRHLWDGCPGSMGGVCSVGPCPCCVGIVWSRSLSDKGNVMTTQPNFQPNSRLGLHGNWVKTPPQTFK